MAKDNMDKQKQNTDKFKVEAGIKEAEFGQKLNKIQAEGVVKSIHKYYEQFGLGQNMLGKIDKHPVKIFLNIEKPYPPILKKAPHPAGPRNRVEIQRHIHR